MSNAKDLPYDQTCSLMFLTVKAYLTIRCKSDLMLRSFLRPRVLVGSTPITLLRLQGDKLGAGTNEKLSFSA